MTTKPTLQPSPFALDIFTDPPHPNSRHARDHKKNKVKPITKPSDKTTTKESK